MPSSIAWKIEKIKPSVLTLTLPTEARVLQISDVHWDNKHCDRAALKRDLDEAKACGAPIVLIGDTFCAMQGKWDRRKDERELRPEHRGGHYFDKLVDSAVEWFAPYAKNIALITYGNHETSILAHHQTDLIQRFRDGLRAKGSPAEVGAYAGFLLLRLHINKKIRGLTVCWNHGNGGGGEVTRGLIDNSRTRSMALADVYIGGHIHRRNADENVVLDLDPRNLKILERHQWFLRSSTYKKESGVSENNLSGYHVERRGAGERPVGGWWWELRGERVGSELSSRPYVVRFRPVPTWA